MPAKVLSNQQLEALLGHVASRKSGKPDRDRAILLLSFKAGLRIAEIAALDWRDLTDATGTLVPSLVIRAGIKCGKGRTLPMHTTLWEALDALHAAAGRPPTGRVIVDNSGRPIAPNTLQRYYARLAASAGFHGVSSHSGRRSFITKLATDHPGRLRDIQRLAGHADPGTTVTYCGGDAVAAAMIERL